MWVCGCVCGCVVDLNLEFKLNDLNLESSIDFILESLELNRFKSERFGIKSI